MPTFLRSTGHAVAAGLLVSAVVALPAAAASSGTAAVESAADVADGTLRWEVRRSFNEYVGAENITVADGAGRDTGGEFTFPVLEGTFDAATGTTDITLDGSIRYATYCGFFPGWADDECALDLSLEEFRLVLGPAEQTLYAHVISRPLSSGNDIPDHVDYGIVPVVHLDADDAHLDVTDTTTTWTDVATSLAAESVPAFGNYAAGAPFAPLALTYDGPGGRPVGGEQWTPPGTPLYEEAVRWLNPTAGSAVHGVHVDSARGVVYTIAGPGTPEIAPYVQALDSTTLEPLGSYAPTELRFTQFAGTLDHESGTLFVPHQAADGTTAIYGVGWNAASDTFDDVVVGVLPTGYVLQANPVWDAATGSVHALTTDPQQVPVVQSWTRADDGWAHTQQPLPTPEGWPAWYTPGTTNDSFAVTPSGALVLARANGRVLDDAFEQVLDEPAALLIEPATGEVAEIPGTGASTPVPIGDPTWAWSQVHADATGRLAFTNSDYTASPTTQVLPAAADDGVTVGTPVVLDDTAGLTVSGAIDPESGMTWLKDAASGRLWAVADDAVLTSFVPDDGATSPSLAVGTGGELLTAVRTADRFAGTSRLVVAAVSPTITAEPDDATVAVPADSTTAAVGLTAAASGTPEPEVRWQRRVPGAPDFTDIDDATSPRLDLDVTADDAGTRYRAVFTNAGGALATRAATLTVLGAPVVLQGPQNVTVDTGSPAAFSVVPGGDPAPLITWQHELDGVWTDVTQDDGYTIATGVLTVPATDAGHDGLRVRVELTNEVDTVHSEPATLTVNARPSPSPTPPPSEAPDPDPSDDATPRPTTSPPPPSDGGDGGGSDQGGSDQGADGGTEAGGSLPDTGTPMAALLAAGLGLGAAGLACRPAVRRRSAAAVRAGSAGAPATPGSA